MTRVTQKHLTDAHYESMREYLTALSTPDSIAAELLLRTGMRQEELCVITSMHIDIKGCRVFIEASKDSVSRWIQVDPSMRPKLTKLVELVGSGTLGAALSDAPDIHGQARRVRRVVGRFYSHLFGKDHKYTTHSLRHTFALRMLRATGNDLLKVQLLMGHKSINSTAKYLQYLHLEDLQSTVLSAMG